jgi:hypothetical protein
VWEAENKFDVKFVEQSEVEFGHQERSAIRRIAVNAQNTEG